MLNAWEWVSGSFGNLTDAARSFFDSANPQNAWLKVDLNNDSSNDYELDFNLKKSTYFPELRIPETARKFYVESGEEFKFSVPKDNINGDPPIPSGSYDAYAVGYWAQIENLPAGTHEIEFGGTFDLRDLGGPRDFEISVADTITVADSLDDYFL